MATYTVSNTADLKKYAASAVNGDTILLKAGTYSGVQLQDIVKSGNVTVRSADTANPAVLTDLTVTRSQGLSFSDLDVFVRADNALRVQSSSRINFDRMDVHGTLNGTGGDDFNGMVVKQSTNVTVTNSHFHELADALSHFDSRYVTFSNNLFETIHYNGIVGGGTSDLAISDNVFTNFTYYGWTIHPDAIQIWTGNTTASARNITVSGNVFDRGKGAAIQGIWINDEVGNLPYENVTVKQNVILGANWQGLAVNHAKNATVTDNVVIGYQGQTSFLALRNVASATLSGNYAGAWDHVNSNIAAAGNIQTTALDAASAAAVSAALSKIAVAGQLATADTQIKAAALNDVSLLGYVDSAPASGSTVTFDVVTMDGTAGADSLTVPTIGSYILRGFAGNDRLVGGTSAAAKDQLEGGAGNDSYTVHRTADTIVEAAGQGSDAVLAYASYTLPANVELLSAAVSGITLRGNASDNNLSATSGGNTLYGEGGNDLVKGASGADTLFGGIGSDRLFGNDGDDRLDGGDGDDFLIGGNGNDILLGGAGNDSFEGRAGIDTITGGTGADTYLFRPADFTAGLSASRDTIIDFRSSEGDRINLATIDAKSATTATNEAFAFIGSQGFHGVAGELRYAASGDGIDVLADTNGDRVADFAIHLTGLTSITASSFIL